MYKITGNGEPRQRMNPAPPGFRNYYHKTNIPIQNEHDYNRTNEYGMMNQVNPVHAHQTVGNHISAAEVPSNGQNYQFDPLSKISNMFGLSKQHTSPPGISNVGHNLCFLNSVLQCLCRSGRLGLT